jgi:hypothetical protein
MKNIGCITGFLAKILNQGPYRYIYIDNYFMKWLSYKLYPCNTYGYSL